MESFDKTYIKNTLEFLFRQLPSSVTLLAATKHVSADAINFAIDCGLKYIGENRVNELLDKYEAIDKTTGVNIHFIGTLQQNKVKYIVDKVSMIHSVDSDKLAQEIEKQCAKHNKTMDVLIEINIGNEESKSGILPENAIELSKAICQMPHLRLRGVMAIPPNTADIAANNANFTKVKNIFSDMKNYVTDKTIFNTLSMGMSSDYTEAIKCGSTMVRIGTLIFGSRNK